MRTAALTPVLTSPWTPWTAPAGVWKDVPARRVRLCPRLVTVSRCPPVPVVWEMFSTLPGPGTSDLSQARCVPVPTPGGSVSQPPPASWVRCPARPLPSVRSQTTESSPLVTTAPVSPAPTCTRPTSPPPPAPRSRQRSALPSVSVLQAMSRMTRVTAYHSDNVPVTTPVRATRRETSSSRDATLGGLSVS